MYILNISTPREFSMSSTSWWCRFLSLSDNWWQQKLRHWTEVLAGQKGCPSIVEDTILFAVQTYQRRRSLGLLWALVQFGWWGCPESCGCILTSNMIPLMCCIIFDDLWCSSYGVADVFVIHCGIFLHFWCLSRSFWDRHIMKWRSHSNYVGQRNGVWPCTRR